MKPLALAVLSALALSAAPLRAAPVPGEDAAKELKERYKSGGQKPKLSAAESAPGAPMPEVTLADIEALLVRTGCKKNAEDTAQLAADLKGKYSLVSCHDEIDGLRQVVIVPKSVSPSQQLMYGSIVGHKLLRARLVDHYLVLQFNTQTQYLDLLKQDKDAAGADTGFALAGFVSGQDVSRFEDAALFQDALVNYAGVAKNAEMLDKIPALAAKIAGKKRYRLQASKVKGEWVVIVTSDGNFTQIWPEQKQ